MPATIEAYAIGQHYGSVSTDDSAGIARLKAACLDLMRRYPGCDFCLELEIDPKKMSIFGSLKQEAA